MIREDPCWTPCTVIDWLLASDFHLIPCQGLHIGLVEWKDTTELYHQVNDSEIMLDFRQEQIWTILFSLEINMDTWRQLGNTHFL